MIVISTICITLWVLPLKYAEKRNKDLKFHVDVISDYIPDSKALQIGFVFLTIGLGLFAHEIKHLSIFAYWCFMLGSFGSFLVAATRSNKIYNTKGKKKDWLHILGAGLTFAVATLGTLVISYGNSDFLFGFALAIPLYSLLGFIYRMDNGDKERIVAYPLILWFMINAAGHWLGYPQYTVF